MSNKSAKIEITQLDGGYTVTYKIYNPGHAMLPDSDWWETKCKIFTSLDDVLEFVKTHYKD